MERVFNNHNYVVRGAVQTCHVCGAVEPPLKQPSGHEPTDRASMHMVHKVTAHLAMDPEEWNN